MSGAAVPTLSVRPNGTRSLTPAFQVGCKLSLVFFQYCITANFYWLLVEGLHLHTLLAAVFSPRRFQAYLLIGWGKDAPLCPLCGPLLLSPGTPGGPGGALQVVSGRASPGQAQTPQPALGQLLLGPLQERTPRGQQDRGPGGGPGGPRDTPVSKALRDPDSERGQRCGTPHSARGSPPPVGGTSLSTLQ